MPDQETQRDLGELRDSLSDKLEELHRRAKVARDAVTPSTYLKSPWFKVGAIALVGAGIYASRRTTASGETLLHAAVRSAVMTAVGLLVSHGVKTLLEAPTEATSELAATGETSLARDQQP